MAFSLVELSIVLVIVGLLVGGILAGRSLINASQLRSITVERDRFTTAVNAFRNKYFMLPGDINNATSFWGTAAACPGTSGTPSTDATTCNGNGNSQIDSSSNEQFRFWQHLSNAGLIEGIFSGVEGAAGSNDAIWGSNAPASRFKKAGWATYTMGVYGSSTTFEMDYGNIFTFGNYYANIAAYEFALTPEEAWNLDTKSDDGMPGRGKVIARRYGWCTNAVDRYDLDTTYLLSIPTLRCALFFRFAY